MKTKKIIIDYGYALIFIIIITLFPQLAEITINSLLFRAMLLMGIVGVFYVKYTESKYK